MKAFHASLMGFVVALMLAPPALAAPPSWDSQIDTPKRFTVLQAFNSQAVLDKETGLVWERSPEATQLDWTVACTRCYEKTVGDRKGWRPPSVEELASLIDPTQSNPALPSGHPFTVENALYWSSTTYPPYNSTKYGVNFGNGVVDGMTGGPRYIWCVRGGQGVEPVYYP